MVRVVYEIALLGVLLAVVFTGTQGCTPSSVRHSVDKQPVERTVNALPDRVRPILVNVVDAVFSNSVTQVRFSAFSYRDGVSYFFEIPGLDPGKISQLGRVVYSTHRDAPLNDTTIDRGKLTEVPRNTPTWFREKVSAMVDFEVYQLRADGEEIRAYGDLDSSRIYFWVHQEN